MRDRFYDNTRLAAGKRCLRKFYYRHVVDWNTTSFQKHLAFGSAWHAAMDSIWTQMSQKPNRNSMTQEIAEEAYSAFIENWMENNGPDPKELGPEELKELAPQHPLIALEMLYEYVDARRPFFNDPTFELIDVERPFAVPLDPSDDTLFYVGRLDKVFRKNGLIHIGEHKTTSMYSREGQFRGIFIDSFSPNSQIDGYLHAAHMLYGEKASSLWVDAALVHRTVHDAFKFIPIDRQDTQLDAWLFDTRWWIGTIEDNWNRIEKLKSKEIDSPYMEAFPKNTEACQDYARNCPYIGICKMIPNPLKEQRTPDGFVEDKWSPFERLELEKIGLEK